MTGKPGRAWVGALVNGGWGVFLNDVLPYVGLVGVGG